MFWELIDLNFFLKFQNDFVNCVHLITEARNWEPWLRELELLRKPSPKGMRGGSLRGGVALEPWSTGVPGGPILCTGITFAALLQVAGPRPFRSRDRVSPGGAQGVSQGGLWGSI